MAQQDMDVDLVATQLPTPSTSFTTPVIDNNQTQQHVPSNNTNPVPTTSNDNGGPKSSKKKSSSNKTRNSVSATKTVNSNQQVNQQGQRQQKQNPMSDDSWICVLCRKICHYRGLGDLYGPYKINLTEPEKKKSKPESGDSNTTANSNTTTKSTPKTKSSKYSLLANYDLNTGNNTQEIWIHEDCLVWSEGVHIVGKQILKMEEVIRDSFHHNCSLCKKKGATIGCSGKRCRRKFHFICARDDAICLMNELNFTLICDKCQANQTVGNQSVSIND